VPLLHAVVLRRLADVDAGVGDQDVEAPELLDGIGDHALHLGAVIDVGHQCQRLAAQRLDRSGVLLGIPAHDGDLGAGLGEPLRDAQPDAPVAPGNKGNFSCEIKWIHGKSVIG